MVIELRWRSKRVLLFGQRAGVSHNRKPDLVSLLTRFGENELVVREGNTLGRTQFLPMRQAECNRIDASLSL